MWTGTCSAVLHWSPCLYSAYAASFSRLITQRSLRHPSSLWAHMFVRSHQMITSTLSLIFPGCICALGEWENSGLAHNVCCGAWVPNLGRECSESACYFNKNEAYSKSKPCEWLLKINQGGSRNIPLTGWWIFPVMIQLKFCWAWPKLQVEL